MKPTDAANCRELWAAIEARPPLRVGSVVVTSTRYRWACLVCVPWSRYAIEVGTRDDLEKLFDNLAAFEAEQANLLESPEVAAPAEAKPPAPPEAAPLDPTEPPDKWSCPKCGRRTESAFSNCDDCVNAPADAKPVGQLSLF